MGREQVPLNTAGDVACNQCRPAAGIVQVGDHFMGKTWSSLWKVVKETFNNETTRHSHVSKTKNMIQWVLDLTLLEAIDFFIDQLNIPVFYHYWMISDLVISIGPAFFASLSGGEAQRVKTLPRNSLVRPSESFPLYPWWTYHRPASGRCHKTAFRLNALTRTRNTIIVIEHHLGMIPLADHVVDLGPESGNEGGFIVTTRYAGRSNELPGFVDREGVERIFFWHSVLGTRQSASANNQGSTIQHPASRIQHPGSSIQFKGISTNTLKTLMYRSRIINNCHYRGFGEREIVAWHFDTIYAEGMNRFLESFSTYARTRIGIRDQADFEEVSGLTLPLLLINAGLVQIRVRR